MTLDTGAGSVSVKLSLARLVPRLWATWLPGGIVGLVLAVAGILPPPVTVVMSVGIGFIAVWSAFIFSLGFGLELCETGLKRHLPSFHPAFIFMGARLIDEVAWSEVESITSMWLLPLVKIRRKSRFMPFLAPKKSVMSNCEAVSEFLAATGHPVVELWR